MGDSKIIFKFQYLGVLLCLLMVPLTHAEGRDKRSHQFRSHQCVICHETVDDFNGTADLPQVSSKICIACHPGMTGSMSHPVDVLPDLRVPPELPLFNGRLSCLTCHIVHPSVPKANANHRSLLRRPGTEAHFCTACHRRKVNDHALFEKVHPVQHSDTGRRLALDAYTLQCAQCHDRHLRPWRAAAGKGTRKRSANGPGRHPVGVVFAEVAAKNPKSFNPSALLSEEMRLFDGRIGCGTCHSAYSKEKNMLVVDNRAGGLCLQCHIK